MYSPDDFDELLSDVRRGASDGPSSSAALRESVLAQTTGVLRTRRRMKRLGIAAALAGCYLAGMLTMSLLHVPGLTTLGSAGGLTARVEPRSENGKGESMPLRPLVRPEDDGVVPGAPAVAAKLSRYDRLRRAGDRQLDDENDIAAAARTYRRALQLASPAQRNIAPGQDTWLLMAMKNDQLD
jgi:hypothetical protein